MAERIAKGWVYLVDRYIVEVVAKGREIQRITVRSPYSTENNILYELPGEVVRAIDAALKAFGKDYQEDLRKELGDE